MLESEIKTVDGRYFCPAIQQILKNKIKINDKTNYPSIAMPLKVDTSKPGTVAGLDAETCDVAYKEVIARVTDIGLVAISCEGCLYLSEGFETTIDLTKPHPSKIH